MILVASFDEVTAGGYKKIMRKKHMRDELTEDKILEKQNVDDIEGNSFQALPTLSGLNNDKLP